MVPTGRLPLAAGRVIFIRRVSVAGTVTVLSQSFRVGKKHRGLYLQMVVDTGPGRLTAYLNGRVLKRWSYSNSRPSERDSSWFAHFDSDKMMRHHRDVEKDLRYGLLEPEPARFWRSSACFGS